jgi:FMN-dependent NADH-azoreductase
MKILHIDSSPLHGASASRELTAAVTARLLATNPAATTVYRDLAAQPLAHWTGAAFAPPAGDAAASPERAISDAVLGEFKDADVIVVGAPMYNFSIPTQLKAWIDRIARAGETFRYTAQGPEGLAVGKRVVIVSTRGGNYDEPALASAFEHQESYLLTVFGFLGIRRGDIEIVRAQGLALGPDARAQGMTAAHAQIGVATRIAA